MVLEIAPRLKEYISLDQFNLLKKYKKLGTLSKKQLTRPLWLTAQEAKELGYNAGEEDYLLTPTALGEGALYGGLPELTITEPRMALRGEPIATAPTVAKEGDDVLSMLKGLYPEKIKALPSADEDLLFKEYQRTEGQYDIGTWRLAGSPLRPEMEFDYLQDLSQRATPGEGEAILRGLGATEEDIDQFIGIETRQAELEDLVAKTFPGYDLEGFAELVETDIDTFLDTIKTGGISKDKIDLLKILGYSSEAIGQILPAPSILRRSDVVTDEDIRKQLKLGGVSDVEIDKIIAERQGSPSGVMPSYDWLDRVGEIVNNPAQLVPYLSSGVEMVQLGKLLKTANDLEAGREVNREDLLALQEFVDRSQKDTTWGYKVMDTVAQLLPFAGEFLITIPVFGQGKAIATKASLIALKKIATKTGAKVLEKALVKYGVNVVGTIGGGTLRTIPAGLTRIPASTLEKQLQGTLTGDEESVWESAVKSLGEQWVEVVSESTGGLFTPLTAPIKGQLTKLAIFKAFQKANPTAKANDIKRVVESLGYHGVLGEMLEERVADVGHGVLWSLGLSDQKFSIPSKEQLSVELVAFSVPGMAVMAIERAPFLVGEAVAEAKARPERGAFEIPGKKPEEVTPAPEVTKIEPTYENLAEGQTLVDQAGDRYTLTKIEKEGVPAKWAYTVKGITIPDFVQRRPLGEIERYYKIEQPVTPTAPTVAIPKAEAAQTWTEAGIQPSMLPEDVAAIEIRPPANVKITQISMDDQLKLEQAKEAAEEAPEETEEAYQAQWEIEGLKAVHQIDPVAQKRIWIGKSKKGVDLYRSLDWFISLKEQNFPEYFTVKQAQLLRPNDDWSYYTQKGTPQYNHIPRNNVLDTIAQELGYDYTGGIDDMVARVMQIRAEKARIVKLERQAVGVEEGLPYLSVPEETTLPMPDEVRTSEDRVVMPPPPPKEPPPPEPTPTHPPQPAPIEAGRITMPDLQAPQTVVDMYSKPDFWRRAANLPLVRKAVGLFNPAAVANNPAQQAIILRAALKDEGAQKAQAVMSHLWEIGTQERVWGKTDQYGYLEAEQFAGFTIDDIRTNPVKFSAEMTEQQKEWIKRASEIEKVKLDALKRNGIEINELSFEDGGEYAGRRVMGKFNDAGELIESGRIGVGGRVGAKQAFEKTRVFKTAEEGILAGYRYMNSDEALYYNTIGAYNKIADRQMADWILSKVDWRTTKAPEALVLQAEAARLRLRKAQQLLAALNRAVRGERVPSNTINSIASVYADQADTLRNLIPELQKPSPETASIVQTLTAEAKALISEAKLEYYQAVNERARAREEAMRVKYEEASIAHPAFAGKIFTGAEAKEIADILNKGLSPQFIEALGAVNKVNAIGRFFMLAGDASPMAIQLQFLAFYRPVAYAKAWGGFVRALFDPEFQYRQYANNRDLINRHPTLILSGRGTEFTEFMGRGGLGKKLGVLAKPLVPFQKAFEGCLDTAGIELAKSLDHRCTTPEATLQVDQFINEFRGITSSARIGVSSTQRQVETAILLAPRYNRAIAAYLFDIVHGGLRGELARMSIAQGFAGLAAMAVAISIALGEDDDEIWQHFDPRSPKFFTWDVMGVKIGLGGKVRSVLKTFGNMLRTGEVGQPALNFLRGNLSPVASTGLDLLTGKDYIGEPTRDNVLNFSKTILQNFMMIWTQTFLMEGGTLKDKALIATAEFLGLRGYDISAKKELKIKDLADRLGEQVGKTPVLTKKKPDIYDCRNIFSDVKNILKNIPPEDVLADKGYAGWGHLVVYIENSEAKTLPDIAFKDYNFDKEKGDTFDSYMAQWAERQRIEEAGERATYTRVKIVEGKEERTTFEGLEALNAHKVDYPNAQRGNLSKRDRELLLEYNVAADKRQFIKEHPEIKVNKLTDWLKSNPRENAIFALVGQADILSKEAYSEFQKIIKEMDIPDAAVLPQTLPPESSLDTHFSYMDMVAEGTHPSWEAQLLIKQDAIKAKEAGVQSYAEWKELKLSESPIAALELKVKNRVTFDKLDAFSDKDSPEYIADEKARAEAIKKFRADNPEFVDDTRRIEAIEKGTDDNPIDEKLVSSHVEYGKLIDQEGIGSSSAETMLYRVDNPDYDAFRTDTAIWDKQALTPIDQSRIPIWRIDVKYEKEDAEYQAILDKYEGREETQKTDEYMASHEDYRKDDRRREAYGLSNSKTGEDFPLSEVENYVQYFEYPAKGFRRERMCYDDFGNLNAFGKAMHEVVGNDIKPFNKIPDVTYDDIYDQYPDQFDEIEGLSVNTSPYYEDDNETKNPITGRTPRQQRAYELRFDDAGKLTEFGLAEVRRDAYGAFVPTQYSNPEATTNPIDDYVGYYTIDKEGRPADWADSKGSPLPWYEDDWFIMEHPDFYKEVWLGILGNKKWDFRSVPPTRELGAKYITYLHLAYRYDKDKYRLENPDLDEWAVSAGIWKVTMTEKKRRLSISPSERFIEELRAMRWE